MQRYLLNNAAYKTWYQATIRGAAWLFGNATVVTASDPNPVMIQGELHLDVRVEGRSIGGNVPLRFLTPINEGK